MAKPRSSDTTNKLLKPYRERMERNREALGRLFDELVDDRYADYDHEKYPFASMGVEFSNIEDHVNGCWESGVRGDAIIRELLNNWCDEAEDGIGEEDYEPPTLSLALTAAYACYVLGKLGYEQTAEMLRELEQFTSETKQ